MNRVFIFMTEYYVTAFGGKNALIVRYLTLKQLVAVRSITR